MSVPIVEQTVNLPVYNVNSISFSKISVNIPERTIYLNCSLITNGVSSVRIAPIYIFNDEFNNMVDIPKLYNIVDGIYGLTITTTPPPVSKFRYIPQAPIAE